MWDWEDFWCSVGGLVVVLAIAAAGCCLFAEKNVRSYYLGTTENGGTGTCVRAQIEWDEDHIVFCGQDIAQVLDVLAKANASLHK